MRRNDRWFERIYEYLVRSFKDKTAAEVVLEHAEDGYLSDSVLELARRLMTKDEFIKLLDKVNSINHDALFILFEEEYYEGEEEVDKEE